jgi:hypothetical protein
MHDTPAPDRDPCDHLLAAPLAGETRPLREALLRQTTRALRRRRLVRRAALAAALAACYAAGLLTMQWWAARPHAATADPPGKAVVDDTPPPHEERPAPVPPLVAEEEAARAADAERAALYRRAGDRYLEDENDPEAALRCYGRALDSGSAAEAQFSPDDNWLLMAIKNAREKEKRNGKKG